MELELRDILRIIWKRWWIIVTVIVIALATSGIISYFYITPIYEASTDVLINEQKTNGTIAYDANTLNTSMRFLDTYSVIIKSPRIMEKAIENMGLALTPSELSNKASVSVVKNSVVMNIKVSDSSQATAVKLANGIAETFQKEVANIYNNQVDNVQILSPAKEALNTSPVKPRPVLNMAIAFVVGLMTSIGLVFLLEYFDNTLKTEVDIENCLGLTVLGSIGIIEEHNESVPFPTYQAHAQVAAANEITPLGDKA